MLDDDFFGRFFLWANSLATLFFAAVVAFSGVFLHTTYVFTRRH